LLSSALAVFAQTDLEEDQQHRSPETERDQHDRKQLADQAMDHRHTDPTGDRDRRGRSECEDPGARGHSPESTPLTSRTEKAGGYRSDHIHPWSGGGFRPRADVDAAGTEYFPSVAGDPGQAWAQADEVRLLVPIFALAVAVVAALADPTSAADLLLMAIPVAALGLWSLLPNVPLWLVAPAVVVPVVVAQRSGTHEPLMFEASVLAFVVARWSDSLITAVALGLLAIASPVAVSLVETHGNVSAGIWILGIAFPWLIGRAVFRQRQLAAQLETTRRALAEQAISDERRRIARDVHDFVGHGLAAVMLQVTSARHVLRRDVAAAEEALRSAEEVGRRSMQELRRTVALLRSDDDQAVLPPIPSAAEIPALVDDARAGGLAVELRMRGDLTRIAPSVGLAMYRIVQEALANAARHAPRARTLLRLELTGADVALVVETAGPLDSTPAREPQRRRYGLIGMRERATALGGEFAAGPTPEGWRVSCRLPLEAAEDPHGERAWRG
jgi:signal transduction histidine kinase